MIYFIGNHFFCFPQRAASDRGACLVNNPSKSVFNTYDKFPGQSLSADDQCKMIYGSSASFCHVSNLQELFLS